MAYQYGKPIYGTDGQVIGYTSDRDGDGIYDDVETVVSNPISEGSRHSVITTDNDGDGTYDDHVIIIHDGNHEYAHTTNEETSSHPVSAHYSGSYCTPKIPKKFLKVAGIVALALIGFSLVEQIFFFILAVIAKTVMG